MQDLYGHKTSILLALFIGNHLKVTQSGFTLFRLRLISQWNSRSIWRYAAQRFCSLPTNHLTYCFNRER